MASEGTQHFLRGVPRPSPTPRPRNLTRGYKAVTCCPPPPNIPLSYHPLSPWHYHTPRHTGPKPGISPSLLPSLTQISPSGMNFTPQIALTAMSFSPSPLPQSYSSSLHLLSEIQQLLPLVLPFDGFPTQHSERSSFKKSSSGSPLPGKYRPDSSPWLTGCSSTRPGPGSPLPDALLTP